MTPSWSNARNTINLLDFAPLALVFLEIPSNDCIECDVTLVGSKGDLYRPPLAALGCGDWRYTFGSTVLAEIVRSRTFLVDAYVDNATQDHGVRIILKVLFFDL